MIGLLYKAIKYYMDPKPLNQGEKDQPAPLRLQKAYLEDQLERVNEELRLEEERVARIRAEHARVNSK